MNVKIFIFHVYFFNMDISIITALTCLKIRMCIADMCMEGSMSQKFCLGLSFCFILRRRRNFEKKLKRT